MHSLNEQNLRAQLPKGLSERVESIAVRDGRVSLVVEASGLSPAARQNAEAEITAALKALDGVEAVNIAMMAERQGAPPTDAAAAAGKQNRAAQCGPAIIAVGSGKGGVGKSTLAANLAIALAAKGRRVGLVDADIYGPSLPRIMGNEGERPKAEGDKLTPVPSRWGVPLLSMGQLVEQGKAIAWRGPMAGRALEQMIDANWGDTELLVVDLPPGTGDVQLTMLQRHRPAGAVIVSTPQDLALIDAERAVQLFELSEVPIIGLVENMAGYACPNCGEISDPFGQGGVEAAAKERGLPFLGRIPLTMAIRSGGDDGQPAAIGDGAEAEAFRAIAEQVMDALTIPA